jgi:hypothetical protein
MRRDPARSALDAILTDEDPLYARYVPRARVLDAWNRLLRGAPAARAVGLYATLEIWLQQALRGRYRSAPF